MKLIAGLGNPGPKYENTRHNVGFMVVDAFAKRGGFLLKVEKDLLCYLAKSKEFVIIKPSTFMNKSGEAVRSVAGFYKIEPLDILVIHDDLDLPFGKIRMSFDSMSAGHKGVESVIESLAGPEFGRLKVGIGSPNKAQGEAGRPSYEAPADAKATADISDSKLDAEKFVLEDFSVDELRQIDEVIGRCCEAIRSYIDEGIDATMNRFN